MTRRRRAKELLDWAREQGLSMQDFPLIYNEARRRWSLTRYETSEIVKMVTEKLK